MVRNAVEDMRQTSPLRAKKDEMPGSQKLLKGNQPQKNIDPQQRTNRSLVKVFLVDIIRIRRSSRCRNMEGLHISLTSSLEFNAIFS